MYVFLRLWTYFSNIRIFSFIWAFRCVFLKFFYVDTFSTKNLRIFCRFAYCVLFLRFLFFVHVHCTYICGQMLWLCMLRFTSSSDMTSSGDNGGQESTDGQHQLTIQVDQVQGTTNWLRLCNLVLKGGLILFFVKLFYSIRYSSTPSTPFDGYHFRKWVWQNSARVRNGSSIICLIENWLLI